MKISNGIPEVRVVMMHVSQYKIIDTWQTIGMKATDSNDVVATDVFVPAHLTCALSPTFEPTAYFSGHLYRYPALGAGIASLIAPVALAIARSAIKEIILLADKKVPFGSSTPLRERGSVQRKLGLAEALIQSARAYLYQTISDTWLKVLAGETISLQERAELILTSTHTNQSCLQVVDMMYSVSGTHGIYLKNKLAHLFADAQVIRQHGFSNESRYESVAQVYLGLQPDLPVIAF
jgi:alkylation response protein AidB-like acyl-CoA dehydrogenase